MSEVKRFFKRNSHNSFFKGLAGFGRALNRLYENRNHDIFSNGEVTVLRKIAMLDPSVIIDGGANVGLYSLTLNRFVPHCKVYAFEPVESTYIKLADNVKKCSSVIPVMKGLYKESCSRQINLFNADEHSSLYEIRGDSYKNSQKQYIELIPGDDFLKENGVDHVDFLKLDVEGAEYDALLGFQDSIKQGKIKAIQFEYGYINITTRKLLIDYYDFFDSNGYIVGKIFPKTVEFRKYDYLYEDFIGPNFIAVHKSETRLISLLSSEKI
ncbi:MAG TPA: FkbM family methyltransferase [Bacteroidales bacterium]|jgi:FkbM family methyltransferase|nr:FkbM family methyltransferase [Bacteroidales bacterium]